MLLDASALLALLKNEPGAAKVSAMLDDACMSRINLAEVLCKLAGLGFDAQAMADDIAQLGIEVLEFLSEDAVQTARWHPATRMQGLSLGDLACLATAKRLACPVLTADRVWQHLALGVTVDTIR